MTRRDRLVDLVGSHEVYDKFTSEVLDGQHSCPRYVVGTSEGSSESTYIDNPNWVVCRTLDDVAAQIQGELHDGWAPNHGAFDLDTGELLSVDMKVTGSH